MKPDQAPSLRAAQTQSGTFVEVGTWEGDFSYELLTTTTAKKVYCVDPYKHFEDASYPDGMNSLTQEQFDAKYERTRERFRRFGDRAEFLRTDSVNAARLFSDESVDFVYIDGNHDSKAVFEDICAWYPKVKNGGYLCGDDIYSTDISEHDSNGNVLRVWNKDAEGKPTCWGHYGTYTALLKARELFGFDCTINDTQFLIHKRESYAANN
jgi:hypothetical protein